MQKLRRARAAVAEEATRVAERALSREAFIWIVGSLCAQHSVPFEPSLLLQQSAPPYDDASLQDALHRLGLVCESGTPGAVDGPAIAWLALDPGSQEAPFPHLLARLSPDEAVLFPALQQQPIQLPRGEFERRLVGSLLFTRCPARAPSDSDAVQDKPAFGFRWFVPALLSHKRIWRDVLLASLVIQLLALGLPLMTQAIIDKVIVHRTESTLIALGGGLAIFMLFSALMSWVRQYLILHTGTRIDALLGSAVFKHLLELPARYFQHRPTGVVSARLHGVEQIREFLSSAVVSLILDLPFLVICLALMFSYSLTLTAIALGFLALIVVASVLVSPIFQARLNQEFLLAARNQGFVTEYVAGMETVKSLQMEPILQRRYGGFLAAHLRAGFATRQVGNTYQVVANTLEQGMTLAILLAGAWIVMQPPTSAGGTFTIGMLVAFQMFAGKLSQPILRLVGLWQQFQQARLAVTRLGDLMDAPAEPYSLVPARASRADGDPGGPLIAVEALAFRYGDDRPLLYEGFNFTLQAGECVGLTGPSGSGKSTLAKLLQGFYLPTHGRILVDGIDSRHLAANELRAMFGVVPQETVLFSGSVLDNLLLGDPHAGFEQAVHACRMAEIHDVIEALPQGYQTEIGERGAGLSGGQKQRLAIARALIKRPRVLLFDEATSNLDQATAEAFAHTIDKLRGQVTILFITHAYTHALKFDRVVTLGGARAAPTAPAHPTPSAAHLHVVATAGGE